MPGVSSGKSRRPEFGWVREEVPECGGPRKDGGAFRRSGGALDETYGTDVSPKGMAAEEERGLWRRCKEGDEEAREALILQYRPLVFWFVRQFQVSRSSFPDLVQEGMMALIEAVDRFDPEKGNRFSTYAYYRVRGHMVNFLQRRESRAPLPVDDMEPLMDLEGDHMPPDWMLVLRDGMASLSARESAVLDELVVQGTRAKEYAEELRVDVSYVYRIQRRALAKLRLWMGLEGSTP